MVLNKKEFQETRVFTINGINHEIQTIKDIMQDSSLYTTKDINYLKYVKRCIRKQL